MTLVVLTPVWLSRESGRVTKKPAEPWSVQLALADILVLVEALDAHEYWQLGDVLPRNDGMVWIPGDSVYGYDRYWVDDEPTADQVEAIEAVRECRGLASRLLAEIRTE